MHEWISLFDPEDRSWVWWDVVILGGGDVSVFVDTRGEPVVPFEELWWMLYAAGAKSVSGPSLSTYVEWGVGDFSEMVPLGSSGLTGHRRDHLRARSDGLTGRCLRLPS